MNPHFDQDLTTLLTRNWWVALVSGVAAILFGILALIWPHITLATLIVLFGIYAIIQGIVLLAQSVIAWQQGRRWVWIWGFIAGLLSIGAGIAAFAWPGTTALVLLYIIATWAIVLGIYEVIAAIALHDEVSRMWLRIIGGIIMAVFGIVLFIHPGAGAIAMVWLIGIAAIVFGITRIALAFELRREPEEWMLARGTEMPPTPA